jgi:hypothetical protein
LDERTLLVWGHARYALETGGFAEGAVSWLDEFEDGLLRRLKAFTSE